MARRRVRRHANPFNARAELGRLDRLALFGREAPLEVELGPAYGGFLIALAKAHPERDFVGIEVRSPMVDTANERKVEAGVSNVCFLYANALVNIDDLAEPGVIVRFHVHFPDPCFKKRHHKRRLVQPKVVRAMSRLLPIDGEIYAQSDVLPLAEEMYDFFAADGALESALGPSLLVPRPITESTEWERDHERRKEPIYRMLFRKIREPEGPIPELDFRATQPLAK